MLDLIDEVLDFSKIEAGKIELKPGPFEIADAVQGVVELLAPRARDKGLEIGWYAAPDLPQTVIGDEMRVRQILMNLVGTPSSSHKRAASRSLCGARRTQAERETKPRCVSPCATPVPVSRLKRRNASSASSNRPSKGPHAATAAPDLGLRSRSAWSARWTARSP